MRGLKLRAVLLLACLTGGLLQTLAPGSEAGASMAGPPVPPLKPLRGAAPSLAPASPFAAHAVARPGFHPRRLTDEAGLYRQAFRAAEKRRWKTVLDSIERGDDPLLNKTLRWLYLGAANSPAGFEEITAFLKANPHWPRHSLLILRAEGKIAGVKDEVLAAWFADEAPRSGSARIRYGEILLQQGRRKEAKDLIAKAWRENDFSRADRRKVYKRHGKLLTPADHIARMQRLMWQNKPGQAKGLYSLLPAEENRIAKARFAMAGKSSHSASLLKAAKQGESGQEDRDLGLLYEEIRWLRRHKKHDQARRLLRSLPKTIRPHPRLWWIERRYQSREALSEGEISLAYDLAAFHEQPPGSVGFAEAEWLAGWIALRFLNEADTAISHFVPLYNNVKYPISRARAAYWAGRAFGAMGRPDLARKWYKLAAVHPETFYGQLSNNVVPPDDKTHVDFDARPTEEERGDFEKRELVQVLRALHRQGESDLLRPFYVKLSKAAEDRASFQLLADLARQLSEPSFLVRLAKRAAREQVMLPDAGFPVLPLDNRIELDNALVHALIRQESEFRAGVKSRVGATGLMQLMPRTARGVAQTLGVRYEKARLTEPEYNVLLGRKYLADLIERFSGSYVLSIASYNAGPHRIKRWIREFGDPRDRDVDVIDWIEQIPYSETRNYVQRVLENIQIYRAKLKQSGPQPGITFDLRRIEASNKTGLSAIKS